MRKKTDNRYVFITSSYCLCTNLIFPVRIPKYDHFLLEETNDSAGFEVHVHIVETRAGG